MLCEYSQQGATALHKYCTLALELFCSSFSHLLPFQFMFLSRVGFLQDVANQKFCADSPLSPLPWPRTRVTYPTVNGEQDYHYGCHFIFTHTSYKHLCQRSKITSVQRSKVKVSKSSNECIQLIHPQSSHGAHHLLPSEQKSESPPPKPIHPGPFERHRRYLIGHRHCVEKVVATRCLVGAVECQLDSYPGHL
jgi:hypothetical protein